MAISAQEISCADMATNDEFSLQLIQGESSVGAAKSPVGAAGACVGGGNVPPFCKNRSPKSKVFLCGRPQRMWVGSREPKVSFVVARRAIGQLGNESFFSRIPVLAGGGLTQGRVAIAQREARSLWLQYAF